MGSDSGRCSVGHYLGKRLVQVGVRHYFSVPGDFNLVLLDELLKTSGLEMVGCCNELNAGYAAEGYARAAGVGALVATYSVGGLSALNAVACAYAEDLPVIAIVGGINSDSQSEGRVIHHGLGEVRYGYQRDIYAQVTAGAFVVHHAAEAPAVIDQAIMTATKCRKPVYLEIPCNLAALDVPAPAPHAFGHCSQSDPAALAAAVGHAATLLNHAQHPVLVAGSRIRPPEAQAAFRTLADASGYAVATLPAAKGMFPEMHAAYIGMYWGSVGTPGVAAVVESADACLLAGTVLSDYATVGYTELLDPQKLIVADPHEVRIAGVAYADVAMADFLAALAAMLKPNCIALEQFHRTRPAAPDPEGQRAAAPLTVRALSDQVQTLLASDTALIVETGDSWFNGLKRTLPDGCRFEIQFQAGSIGWSVPATLGYALGCKRPTRVIAMIGDGSFQLTAQEVSTMIRHGLRPLILLINNRGYTIEAQIHDGPYNRIKNWDYAGLIDVFNAGEGHGLGLRAATEGELAAAIQRANSHDGLCLIEVAIAPDDCSPELREWGSRVAAANARPPRPRPDTV